MNLHAAILKEHTKAQTDRIVKYVGNDPKRFAELMQLFLKGEPRVVQRSAWPLSYCVKAHPELIKPYFGDIVKYLEKPGTHGAAKRNITRLLQHVEIPKRYHGRIMDICFRLVADPNAEVAWKAFSMTVLERLSQIYPEIKPELRLIIEERMDHESAGFRARARKVLKKL
jgi:hypothetical protein